ncbi:MAG: hypothetical protein EOO41_01840 [Methanobacteriota archaeon]|nr:MAG: hypothetical protein EOO41_01840 [Euryarchaeota archaeon]
MGETDAARLERQRSMLEGEWRDALHPDGRVFFYHTTTHERRWDAPAEGLYARRRYALMRYFESHGKDPALPASATDAAAAKPTLTR